MPRSRRLRSSPARRDGSARTSFARSPKIRRASRIRCLVRSADDAALLEVVSPRIEALSGDVRDPSVIDALFDGVGRASVFHAAAVIHPARFVRELFDVNVGGTQLVLDRARRVGASRFVHVSSNSPFGANASTLRRLRRGLAVRAVHELRPVEARSRAARAKRSCERGDLATVIVRPPWFYGPSSRNGRRRSSRPCAAARSR